MFVGGLSHAGAGERPVPVHENPRWGFKVRAPARWKRRLVQLEEPWIADKFFPDQPLRARGAGGQRREHVPSLWVIGFPHVRAASKGKQDEALTRIAQKTPYKDYLDFVKREEWASTGSGGWFVSREETIEHADHTVDVFEIKVEKLVRAPLRIITWVYHCKNVDFAVQILVAQRLVFFPFQEFRESQR